MVKHAYLSSGGSEFSSQGDPVPLASRGTCTHLHIPTHRHTHIHIIKIISENIHLSQLHDV